MFYGVLVDLLIDYFQQLDKIKSISYISTCQLGTPPDDTYSIRRCRHGKV